MTLHQIQEHPEFVEGCFGCRIGTVAIGATVNAETRGSSGQWQKKFEKSLEKDRPAYARMRAAGLQPARVTGAAELEKADTRFEIESGNLMPGKKAEIESNVAMIEDMTGKSAFTSSAKVLQMSTGQNWIDQTRNYLLSGFVEQRNKLDSNYTAGSGTITLLYPMGDIRAGSTLSIGTNTFYVWAVSNQTATVSGGESGTTDTSATSGTIVRVNPRFTDNDIWNALNDDLADLSSPINGLYQMSTVDFNYNPVLVGYDLGSIADNFIDLYEVKHLSPGPSHDNRRIPKAKIRINRDANLSQFASGFGMQLFDSGFPGYNVRVLYKAPLTMPTSTSTDLSTTGLLASAYDLPPLGAAIRLMAGREIKRNFTETQGDTRRASEVGAGAVMQSANGLKQLRQQRISSEAARLDTLYPTYRA